MNLPKQSILSNYLLSATLLIATVFIIGWYATDRFNQFFVAEEQNALASRAITVRETSKISGNLNCTVLKRSDPEIRVTIIALDGKVNCDSLAQAETMENHATRPEVKAALSGRRGAVTRFSSTLQTTMLYVAVPYYQSDQKTIKGVIRTAVSLSSIENLLNELYQQFALLIVLLLGVILTVTFNVYKKINQPLAQIISVANLYAKGDFSKTIPEYEITEIKAIGEALNQMASQLSRLENLRQEFVTNVSHELKTPIATIKSYAETLLDGAEHKAEDIAHFLNIIAKQNDRLGAIVDDLLMLSRLETAPESELLHLHTIGAEDILYQAQDICQTRADLKNIAVKIIPCPSVAIKVDSSLMIQAIVNLIDNAIKYSPPNTTITLSAIAENGYVKLSVSDQGHGINEQHLARLFERFYRVDKSRSRQAGGTGLGLAIVKHIVQIHSGEVSVTNNGAAGCNFSVCLPVVKTA